MVVFPNAKINLGLYITARRPDGYHDLETVFYPVPLCDILECMEAPELLFESSGLPIPGDPEHNLVLKAWHVLRRDFPHLPPVHIHLHKIIPMGAGLGGGSSDAAFMLKLLNQLFTLGLANEQLLAYALELGSDCPFFIQNQPAFASGRGEILQPLSFSVPMGTIVLVYPAVHRSTAQAFQQVTATAAPSHWLSFLQQPPANWKIHIENVFEEGFFSSFPALKSIKDRLYLEGADFVSLSGSGSSLFAIFQSKNPESEYDWKSLFPGMTVFELKHPVDSNRFG